MNYTKPEVAVLGSAVRVIEGTQTKGNVAGFDAKLHQQGLQLIPAYDLDA
jgi:hypothetical protein